MNKALFNPHVLIAGLFSLAATVAISGWVFKDQAPGPTLLLDEPLPAPDFTVTDYTGKVIDRGDFLGSVWVCDFFLTRCNGICPILGQRMADLAGQLSQDPSLDAVRLVSFSVDPDHDTLDRLTIYRNTHMGIWTRGDEKQKAELNRRWVHTRAEDRDAFWKIVSEGFKLYVGPSEDDPMTPVAHSGRLVLIDKRGNIRGYYDGLTDDDTPALLADIRRLTKEPAP